MSANTISDFCLFWNVQRNIKCHVKTPYTFILSYTYKLTDPNSNPNSNHMIWHLWTLAIFFYSQQFLQHNRSRNICVLYIQYIRCAYNCCHRMKNLNRAQSKHLVLLFLVFHSLFCWSNKNAVQGKSMGKFVSLQMGVNGRECGKQRDSIRHSNAIYLLYCMNVCVCVCVWMFVVWARLWLM